ncbi:hypothetical protein ACQBAR_07980 [Propionibacteriaceae bacterium Y1685]
MPEPISWLISFAVGFAISLASSIIPFTSAEAYVIAAQASGLGLLTATAVGTGLGAGVGKVMVFWALRCGKRLPWMRALAERPPREGWIGRLQRWNRRMLALVGDARWGVPVLALGALVGIPPLYPMVFVAAASPMRLWVFSLVTVLGRMLRFLLIGYGVLAALPG